MGRAFSRCHPCPSDLLSFALGHERDASPESSDRQWAVKPVRYLQLNNVTEQSGFDDAVQPTNVES